MNRNISRKKIKWFQSILLNWFNKNGRNFRWRNKSARVYEKIIAELLLQRTKAETVASFFKPFVKKYSSWRRLSNANEEELIELLKPLGLWRQRSKTLLKLADEMVKRNGRFPRNREDIELLPGVGQYIANAILLFCYSEPQPLIDVNMSRLLERFFGPRKLADIRYDPYLQELSERVVDCSNPVNLNWAVLDFAALVCRARNPFCEICVLHSKCLQTQIN